MVITGIREYFTLIVKNVLFFCFFCGFIVKTKNLQHTVEKKQELFCILTVIAYLSLKCLGVV